MEKVHECGFPARSDVPTILLLLKRRYDQEMLYSLINYRTLLFLNPARPMPSVFNYEASDYYLHNGPASLFQYPHVYGFVSLIYSHMKNLKRTQHLIISGASDSGKTEQLVQTLLHLANLTTPKPSKREASIIKALTATPYILDAFMKCRCPLAASKSADHFKLSLHFLNRRLNGAILQAGLSIPEFCTDPNDLGKCHNIFDIVLGGLKGVERAAILLDDRRVECLKGQTANNVQNKDSFRKLIISFDDVGLTSPQIANILKCLAAILHLRTLECCQSQNADFPTAIRNRDNLIKAASLLSVDESDLEVFLITENRRWVTDICLAALEPAAADKRIKSFARSLYNSLFEWILAYICQKISPLSTEEQYSIIISNGIMTRATPPNSAFVENSDFFSTANCKNPFMLALLEDVCASPTTKLAATAAEHTVWELVCLQSNVTGEPGVFDAQHIHTQLEKLNCIQQIQKSIDLGFCRLSHEDFVAIFDQLLDDNSREISSESKVFSEQATKILQSTATSVSKAINTNEGLYLSLLGVAELWKILNDIVRKKEIPPQPEHYPPDFENASNSTYDFEHVDTSDNTSRLFPIKQMIESEAARLTELEQIDKEPLSLGRKFWTRTACICTFGIPDALLYWYGMIQPEMRMAWREKVTLCLLIATISGLMLFFIMGLTIVLCPEQRIMTFIELEQHPKYRPHVLIHGIVYDATPLVAHHSERGAISSHIYNWAGRDASALFPPPSALRVMRSELVGGVNHRFSKRAAEDSMFKVNNDDRQQSNPKRIVLLKKKPVKKPKLKVSAKTLDGETDDSNPATVATQDKAISISHKKSHRGTTNGQSKGSLSETTDTLTRDGEKYMHSIDNLAIMMSLRDRCYLGIPQSILAEGFSRSNAKVVIFGAVYNISLLIGKWGDLSPKAVEALMAPWGVDKSAQFRYAGAAADIELLRDYFLGVLDERNSVNCRISKYVLIGSTGVLGLIMLFKFLAALQLGAKRDPEELDKFVIIQVPCYTEGEESLRKTIDSLALLHYDEKRKLLFMVADGMVMGSGNDRPTPRILLDILGVESTFDPPARAYVAVSEGNRRINYAKVYSGLYECGGRRVPYMAIIKVGSPKERMRPGNRGKRDSQMLLLRFLSDVHYRSPMSPLGLEMHHHFTNIIGVDPAYYEYLLMVDADTEVFPDALNRMVSCCVHDAKIMGICGETRLANEKHSVTTMIQVYEYYISHHLAKAFESLFGSVTCLPGCFCLYRIRSASAKRLPLIIKKELLDDYSESRVDTLHKKNLLALGEDRYLTTLMLKHFPTNRTKFTPDATCKTAAPDRWSVLLSQRRRWINSTIHNLFELLLLPNMCGFCCFSMRFVVLVDLYATLAMPASVAYLGFLIYESIQSKIVPFISLMLLAAVYGMQIIVFLLKRQWQHVGWMVIHILAIPLFGFLIPLYAYWHFDDFSWGNTRRVIDEKGGSSQAFEENNQNYPFEMELKTWEDHCRDQKGLSFGEFEPTPLAINRSLSLEDNEDVTQVSIHTPFLTHSILPSLHLSPISEALPPPPPPLRFPRHKLAENNATSIPVEEQIATRLYRILLNANLRQMTRRSIRQQLSIELQVDVEDYKHFINYLIDRYLSTGFT